MADHRDGRNADKQAFDIAPLTAIGKPGRFSKDELLEQFPYEALRETAERYPGLAELAYDWGLAANACQSCDTCAWRCDLLDTNLNSGDVAKKGLALLASVPPGGDLAETVRTFAVEQADFVKLLLDCFLCDRCTSNCEQSVDMVRAMMDWRRLLAFADILSERDLKSVLVDNQWHIYSVYRAIYGVCYPEVRMLDDVQPGEVETLFFPGCSLVSYAPALVMKICAWLSGHGVRFALSDSCCASPLMSAGRTERALHLQHALRDRMREAGIKRVVVACAGCDLNFHKILGSEFEFIPLPQMLLDLGMKVPINAQTLRGTPYTFLDSCHDRKGRFSTPLRQLFACLPSSETSESGKEAFCCGAGGMVSQFDPARYERYARARLDMAEATEAATVLSSCMTCSYTYADTLRKLDDEARAAAPVSLNYLEVLFNQRVDWEQVFTNLMGMWTGEYGPWVCAQLI